MGSVSLILTLPVFCRLAVTSPTQRNSPSPRFGFPTCSFRNILGLPSSRYTSMHMPRLENPADSPHPHQCGCFAWTSSTLQLSSVETNFFSGRCQHFRITVIPVAYALLCLRFTCLVRGQKPLRHRRKTRYWWLVRPYQTGTFTLQGAPSFAWRTNGWAQWGER
jgi:hypothetical protein